MGDATIAWVLFVAYLVVIGGAAFIGIRRVSGFASYSVGSRQVSPVFVGLSLAASMTSAATFVINPGLMYLYGVAGLLGYALATPLGIFIGLTIFSKAFRRVGDRHSALTVPSWIASRYGDARLGVFFAIASLLLITFLVLIVVGLTLVLERVLVLPTGAAMALVIGIPLVYITLGGAGAHTLTSSIQAVIMLVVAVLMIGSGLHYFADGGLGGFLARLTAIDPALGQPTNPASPLFRDYFEVLFANFVIGIAVIMQPHIISKALYLKSERDVNVYLLTGFAAIIVFFSVLVTGLYARLLMPDAAGVRPDTVIPTYMTEVFPPAVRGLVAIGLLSAGWSTMEGLLVALSTIFSNDLYGPYLRRRGVAEADVQQRSMRLSKVFLLTLAPVVAFLSYGQILSPNLSVALLAQNGVYGLFAATFAPILFGIFSKTISKGAIFAASLVALGVHFGMYYGQVTIYHTNPAVTAACALLASTAVAGGSLLWRRPRPQPTAP